ncbi:RNase J family beta-CASP ribonuclease [Candidatus Woesearchaeota archaeon]|nr:RNase J family beta-CASP ribonuclease [Candidatus Woesearchaeota archaeon]
MPIEICTIGGYSSTSGNSTAIKVGEEVVVLDMGLHMENYTRYTEDEDVSALQYDELLKVKAVPDYRFISDWKSKVIGIVPSHGHLDHAGAVPFCASQFPKAPIVCTPYTTEVLKSILADDRIHLPNKIVSVNLNSSYKLSKNIKVEFIYVTHSIPHASLVVLHTPQGKIVYANDYKFDKSPTLGQPPNFERLKQLGKEGVAVMIVECLYAHEHKKTPSESVAKEMLKDVMLGVHTEGKGMIVTTFSSHLARLKSIIELGRKLHREVIFLGRSLAKYVEAGEKIQLINFQGDITLEKHRDKVEKALRRVMKTGKEKYLLVVTGHQGEPKALLSRLARRELPWEFDKGDVVIFSCSIIPVELNRLNREKLEHELTAQGVRIFRDIHVSGHASREDHRDLIEFLQPGHIIPGHAASEKQSFIASLAEEMGFKSKKQIHLMEDGKRLVL